MRELPYDQAILLENLVDPSHVEYAHHAVFGGWDTQLISRMSVVEGMDLEKGCLFHVADTDKDVLPAHSPVTRIIEFRPPTLIRCILLRVIHHQCQAAAFDTSVDAVPPALQGIDSWSSKTGVYAMLKQAAEQQRHSKAAPFLCTIMQQSAFNTNHRRCQYILNA